MCEYIPAAYPVAMDGYFNGTDTSHMAFDKIITHLEMRLPFLSHATLLRRFTNITLLYLNVLRSMKPEDFQEHRLLETSAIVTDTLLQCSAALGARLDRPDDQGQGIWSGRYGWLRTD